MSKVIRINTNTEDKILEYRKILKESTHVEGFGKMIDEANEDAIIRAALETAITYVRNFMF